MRITTKAIQRLNKSNGAKARLCSALNKSYPTIQRWITENEADGKLTTANALEVISEELNMPQTEILEK